MVSVETERLVIRNFKADDWYDLFEYLSQKEVLRYEPRTESNEEECKKIAAERAQGNIFWAVCLKETGKMIGHLYFAQREPYDYLTWMLGYIFNPAYYGQGYATEACRKMLQYAFEQLDAHRVIALCNPENTASWRLLERLSMRREGHFRKEVFFRKTDDGNPIWLDGFQYAILAEEWNKERNNNLIFEPIIEASSLATKFSY